MLNENLHEYRLRTKKAESTQNIYLNEQKLQHWITYIGLSGVQ